MSRLTAPEQGLIARAREQCRLAGPARPARPPGSFPAGSPVATGRAAARLAELLAAFAQELRRSRDAIAVFRGLSRAVESMAAAAVELRRQKWFDLDDGADRGSGGFGRVDRSPGRPAAPASGTFEWVADGWI